MEATELVKTGWKYLVTRAEAVPNNNTIYIGRIGTTVSDRGGREVQSIYQTVIGVRSDDTRRSCIMHPKHVLLVLLLEMGCRPAPFVLKS